MAPVIGRPICQRQRHLIATAAGRTLAPLSAKLPRRSSIRLLERIVESAEAPEARGERDLRHRQVTLVDQPFGEVQPACLRDRQWRCSHVLQKKPIEMTRPYTYARGEVADAGVIERAFVDETQSAPHDRRGAKPRRCSRRGLRTAAQAGPEACFRCGCRGGEIAHIAAPGGRRRRADRTAVDARRGHGDEEFAIEAGIATQARSLQHLRLELKHVLHGRNDTRARRRALAIFGRERGAADSATRRGRSRFRAAPAGCGHDAQPRSACPVLDLLRSVDRLPKRSPRESSASSGWRASVRRAVGIRRRKCWRGRRRAPRESQVANPGESLR
jgi:hypothetical protein